MEALKYGIPRFASQHRAGDPREVLEYLRAMVERLIGDQGPTSRRVRVLGGEARPILRDLADIEMSIHRKRRELEDAHRKMNKKAVARRIERDLMRLRFQRGKLEQRLEELAAARKAEQGDVAALLAGMRTTGDNGGH